MKFLLCLWFFLLLLSATFCADIEVDISPSATSIEIATCANFTLKPTTASNNLVIHATSNNASAISIDPSQRDVSGLTIEVMFQVCALINSTPQIVDITFSSTSVNNKDRAAFDGANPGQSATVSGIAVNPHQITVPSTGGIDVIKGGCSALVDFTVSILPITDVGVLINGLLDGQFYIQGINGSTISFNNSSPTTQSI
jgi:hypothetical protein